MRDTPLPRGFRRATDPSPEPETTVEQLALLPGVKRSDLDSLKDGAAMLIQAGNRVAALALLWSAVAIDPIDLAAHRRLAATLAHGGDIDAAAEEYARYIEFLLPLGELGRATLELQYGASTLGGRPALARAADKIVAAVRAIVPFESAAIAPAAPDLALSTPKMEPARDIAEVASNAPDLAPYEADIAVPDWETVPVEPAPFSAPRLLPKVPFRFCIHTEGDRFWMQLEGGTADLVPDAVRVVDRDENVIETRLVLPLGPGDTGHARVVGDLAPAVAWVVVSVRPEVVEAIETNTASPYLLQAKVGGDWLSLELVDTGCRLGRARAKIAVS